MSTKASGIAWDLDCPKTYGELEFRSTHKFTLLAYVDHADHHGKNIWPAVKTVAKKTGLDERTIQRLTNDLVTMGFLVEDGQGPRGTNKFFFPMNEGGWQPVTPDAVTGDNGNKSLGDIPSGDIPSGDTVSPEFKEPEPKIFNISNIYVDIWGDTKTKIKNEIGKASFETWIKPTQAVHFDFDNSVLWIETRNDYARQWLTNHFQERAQEITGLYVRFLTVAENELEPS